MQICYLTTLVPYGVGETFVLREIDAVRRLGHTVCIIPTRPESTLTVEGYEAWKCAAHSVQCYRLALKMFLRRPLRSLRACGAMFFQAGCISNAFKNLYFFPKALATAEYIRSNGAFDFIHAHWLAASCTVGYIASALTGVPWGGTGHRYDVYANNGLPPKAKTASFLRTINDQGKNQVCSSIPEPYHHKVQTIHLGVDFTNEMRHDRAIQPPQTPFKLAVPANLIPVKGHRFIVEAVHLLKESGECDVRCAFYGDGPLRPELACQIGDKDVDELITMPGYIANDALMALYRHREVDAMLLSSVEISHSEHEGLPVSLMEAMSYRIPVIATDTGGIAELVGNGCGCLIPDKDPRALADAILKLKNDAEFYQTTAEKGFRRVVESFDNESNTEQLLSLIRSAVDGRNGALL